MAMGTGMGDQTLSQTQATSPFPSPSPSSPKEDSSTPPAAPSTSTSKIPFRPRKIRKLSSSSSSNSKQIIIQTSTSPPPVRVLPRPLTASGELSAALAHLRSADPILACVIDSHDPPSFQSQSLHTPFHSLARSILYQQLAFKAASSIYSRFLSLCGGHDSVLPHSVLSLSPHQLRLIGVSARKASYLHDLSNKYISGILSDSSILSMDDKSLFSMLTMVKGIGAWSVHMFMIFSLHRPDVLPVGDLGVRKGVQILYGMDDVPRPSQMEQLCEKWKPYRSVGAWYMWRLVESKGTPTMASLGDGKVEQIEGGGGGGGGGGRGGGGGEAMQQLQMVDPIQQMMLPGFG